MSDAHRRIWIGGFFVMGLSSFDLSGLILTTVSLNPNLYVTFDCGQRRLLFLILLKKMVPSTAKIEFHTLSARSI